VVVVRDDDGALEPSGLVTGWSVVRGAAILDAIRLRDCAVNAGGDVWLSGDAVPDFEWRVGIEHACSTTGSRPPSRSATARSQPRRSPCAGDHVLDPYSGRPPEGVLSVTITGPDLGRRGPPGCAATRR
jgi:thiamine biosynthesis lipoprotein